MQLTDTLALVGSGEARLTNRYDCNVYALETPSGSFVVDTGAGLETETLLERVEAAVGTPDAVLLTHAHADHSQGAPAFMSRDVPVFAPEPSASLLEGGTERGLGIDVAKRDDVYPADYEYTHFTADRYLTPETTVTVGNQPVDVVRCRGHAADHVAYVTSVDGRTLCFVGDAVYPDGSISLLNTPGSSLADYREDIGNLVGRNVDVLLPGHGLPRIADGQQAIDSAADALAGMFTPSSKT